MQKYVFNDYQPLLNYVINQLNRPTPIRVHKTMYFLWAFYAGSFGQLTDDYPKTLYPAQFRALQYGPVIKSLYDKISTPADWHHFINQNQSLGWNSDLDYYATDLNDDIHDDADSIIDQANQVYDYELVLLSQHDESWQHARKYHQDTLDLTNIIKEYTNKINQAN